MDLLDELKNNLGINDEQAKGGTGLLLKLAKEKLGGDFSKVTDVIPDTDDMMKAAPESGAVSGLLKSATHVLGGSAEKFGDIAALSSGFSKLGLNKEMVDKFIPIVLNYAQSKGGDTIKNLMGKVLQ
ncbi:MAG: DUF2780 domain-containing protein [Nitrospiraceae bacterium]|nr:MAG: DUF2780 domain-containing protein [Nitrospiraceae bacterium]